MDEARRRIQEDLRGLVRGDLQFEPLARSHYARDASLYEIDPLGVVVPQSVEDVAATVRYAYENRIPIHARGAGTGLAGESLGRGLVIDFARHLHRIVEVRPESVVVQPGAILDLVNRRLATIGRMLGPDPSGSASCTIGGMIAGNAAGARSLRYGYTADHVERIAAILPDGTPLHAGFHRWPPGEGAASDRTDALALGIRNLLLRHKGAIERLIPRSERDRLGYTVTGVLDDEGVDLGRLLAGSEGTLAVFTEATLRTVPIPAARTVVVITFEKLLDAAAAVADCLPSGPSACELLDWRSLSLIRESVADVLDPIDDSVEAALIIEFEGDDPTEIRQRASALAQRISRRHRLGGDPVIARDRRHAEALLNLRERVRPQLMRMRGPHRAVPLIEDIAVPVASLVEFLGRMQQILKAQGVNWILYAHAGHGQLHIRPFLDMADDADRSRIEELASAVYEAVWDLGGSISGEHGTGLLRTQFLRRQYGELYHLFRGIKEVFDPENVLNPGKIIGDTADLMGHDLLVLPPPCPPNCGTSPAIVPTLRWGDDDGPVAQSSRCNGCGACRTLEPTMRMCPTFRATRMEEAAPRAKADLLRRVAAGTLDPSAWGSDEAREVADLCVHCDLCRIECPAGIDVSGLMMELKAAHVEQHGLSAANWTLSRIEFWARLATRFPIAFNATMRSRPLRWLLERTMGLSRHRQIPTASRTSFLRRAERLGLTKPRGQSGGPRVAYFVDTFANHFDQELASAVVSVLTHAGVQVVVPKGQTASGMSSLLVGDLDHARELAGRNLRVLGNVVRDGYTIVCSEPTAALMLRREYPRLTDALDAGVVAANTMDLGQYLAGLDLRGQLPKPTASVRLRVGYHQPCHLRALQVGTPGLDLVRAIPGVEAEFIDQGCSGIAGTYGLTRHNFLTSMRAGRGLLNRLGAPDIEIGMTECGTCRMQMEQGAPKPTLHPIKILAMGLDLAPDLRRQFGRPRRARGGRGSG